MKALIKYSLLLIACFSIAGSVSYYAVKAFTKSAEEVILPELNGKNILYVLETLTRMGLNAKMRGTVFDDTVPTYAVISQDPPPGSTIKKGRDVILLISKGKRETILPDLRRLSASDAVIAIEKNEFKHARTALTWSDTVRENHVIAQYPVPFATAPKGSTVDLLISRGPKPRARVMPDLSAMTLLLATDNLEKAGLKPGRIKTRVKVDRPAGEIIEQHPPAGAYVIAKDDIVLTISSDRDNLAVRPEAIGRLHYIQLNIPPGFRKRHIRIETDLFGSLLNLYDDFFSPGQEISLLVPVEQKIHFNIYIDEHFNDTIILDPWTPGPATGDISWELLPLQFYPPILQNLETN